MDLYISKKNYVQVVIEYMEKFEKEEIPGLNKRKKLKDTIEVLINDMKTEEKRDFLLKIHNYLFDDLVFYIILGSKLKLKLNEKIKCYSECCSDDIFDFSNCCQII